jgi:DNA replication licensing factor MCM6
MSRFDLFFVVLDECDEDTDKKIAQHIVKIHQKREEAIDPPYSSSQLYNYIRAAKTIKPTIRQHKKTFLNFFFIKIIFFFQVMVLQNF